MVLILNSTLFFFQNLSSYCHSQINSTLKGRWRVSSSHRALALLLCLLTPPFTHSIRERLPLNRGAALDQAHRDVADQWAGGCVPESWGVSLAGNKQGPSLLSRAAAACTPILPC